MKYYIYKLLFDNGKSYIGQTKNVKRRISKHKCVSKMNTNTNTYLYNAIKKYGGWNNAIKNIAILDECENNVDDLEKYYINKYNTCGKNGYNMTFGGEGGDTLSNNPNLKEIGKKISKSNTGKKRNIQTKKLMSDRAIEVWNNPERRKIQSIKMTEIFSDKTKCPMYGKNHSKKTIDKMKNSAIERYKDPSEREKLSIALKGRKCSEETKLKMSLSAKKRFENIKERQKISQSKKGKHLSDNHKQKISAGLIGKHHSKETKRKISKARLGKKYKKNIHN